jgi:DNA primase
MTLSDLLDSLDIRHNADKLGEQSIRCPFPDHDDRHASARVNLDKGLVYCHGCGSTADVIGLFAKTTGLTIPQARAQIGDCVHVPPRKRRGGFRFSLKRRPAQW